MLRKAILVVVSLFILAWPAVVTPQNGNGNGPPTQKVLVVNGASQPVPVSLAAGGSVTVSGSVNANITNQPTVSLASGSSVTVANSATNPLPVQNVNDPATHAFQFSAIFSGADIRIIPVPAGKRLVIQSYDALVSVPTTEPYPGLVIETQLNGGNFVNHRLATQPSAKLTDFNQYEGSAQLTLYSDQNVGVLFNSGTSTATAQVQISGYLIPQP